MINFSTEFLERLGLKFSLSIPTIVKSIIDYVVSGLVCLLGVIVTKDCRFFFSFVILMRAPWVQSICKRGILQPPILF
jgi:hypothetical protein